MSPGFSMDCEFPNPANPVSKFKTKLPICMELQGPIQDFMAKTAAKARLPKPPLFAGPIGYSTNPPFSLKVLQLDNRNNWNRFQFLVLPDDTDARTKDDCLPYLPVDICWPRFSLHLLKHLPWANSCHREPASSSGSGCAGRKAGRKPR